MAEAHEQAISSLTEIHRTSMDLCLGRADKAGRLRQRSHQCSEVVFGWRQYEQAFRKIRQAVTDLDGTDRRVEMIAGNTVANIRERKIRTGSETGGARKTLCGRFVARRRAERRRHSSCDALMQESEWPGQSPAMTCLRDLSRRLLRRGSGAVSCAPSGIARVVDDLTVQSGTGDLRVHCRTGRVDRVEPGGVLSLNHGPQEMKLAEGISLPRHLKVEPLDEHSGGGGDDPIISMRVIRDGWTYASDPSREQHEVSIRFSRTFDPPVTMQKPFDVRRGQRLILRTHLHGIAERQGRWYAETADIVTQDGQMIAEIGRIDWIDLDHNGEILYAKDGCLFRLPKPALTRNRDIASSRLIADLNDMSFEPMEAPRWGRKWS